MTMLPQPPPDAPAPPISAAALRSQRWLYRILLVGMLSMIGLIVLILLSPLVLRSRMSPDRTEAICNARQIGMALFVFDDTYGELPSAKMVERVRTDHPGAGLAMSPRTSNDFFRQLIASEIVTSENMFYAKTETGRRPDNILTGTKALEKGECAFGYVAGLSLSTASPETPLALYPLLPGKRLFDYKLCKKHLAGKAVILCANGTVKGLLVDKSGHAYLNGKDLFDPSQPFWGGISPDVKWPE